METLVDVMIKSVSAGPSGESEHGIWQIHNVLLHESTKKFTYFEKDGETIPEPGMKVRVFDYESEQKGKYTNHTIKRLTYAEEEKHSPKTSTEVPKRAPRGIPAPQSQDIPISVSVMTSYHKDFVISLIKDYDTQEAVAANMDSIIQLANEFLDASLAAGLRVTQAPKAEPNTEPIEIPKQLKPGDEPNGFMDGPDGTPEPDSIPFP